MKPKRNVAVDAYRGFVMLLMMAEVLRFSEVARAYPHSNFWRILAFNQTHVEWTWFGLHDLIQPSFTFLVGVALPYSIRSRQQKDEPFAHSLAHTIVRSIILILLGIFLRSIHQPITYFTFEDTLTQIGMGYTFAFLLAFCRPRWQWVAFCVILFGYWLGVGALPSATCKFRLRHRRCSTRLARSSSARIRRALEQERKLLARPLTSGSSIISAHFTVSL